MRKPKVLVTFFVAVLVGSVVLGSVLIPGRSVAATNFSITTSPSLTPSFNPAVKDYAIRCSGSTTTQLTTTGTDPVTVGSTTYSAPVDLQLPLVAGQEVTVTYDSTSYYIRCLPSDFPNYTSSVTGTPEQANGYMLTLGSYAVVFDTDGVPVWWFQDKHTFSPFDAKFLDASTVAYWDGGVNGYLLRGLDGTLEGTVGGGSLPLDFHDLQRLPDGNFLALLDQTRNCPADLTQCVDLSSWGRSAQSTITDNVIVELNSQNQVIWSWSVADHIDVASSNTNWRNQFPDVIHMNSILYDGNGGIIFSARHLDAVYRIEMATGDITWKLGGSPIPQSLSVSGDPYSQLFSGQHFARLLPDGSLSVHDNGTRAGRPPRAVRFTVDSSAMTATEVEQVTDGRATTANCCGSAEKLSGGDWVMSWGANGFMTELDGQGNPQLTITYPGYFSYRAADVPATVDALRQGMNAMVAPLTDVPSTTILVPGPSATLSGSATLDAAAADPVNLSSVRFVASGGALSGAPVGTATPTYFGWIVSWDTTSVPDGTYQLQSVATNASGAVSYSPPVTVTVFNPLTTTVLIPSSGTVLSGSQFLDASAVSGNGVTTVQFDLSGAGFSSTPIATAVPTLYGWLAGWNSTSVPNGSYTIESVATDAQGNVANSAPISVVVSNPTVTAVSPASGPGGGGTKVFIIGTRFTGATAVHFGSTSAASFTVSSATKIVAYAPAELAGTVDITVTVNGVTSGAVLADRFTFLAPSVSRISPLKGPVAGGTSVTVIGANFAGATQVRFGSAIASFSLVSPQKLVAVAPPGPGVGPVDVTVTTPGGTSGVTAGDRFSYQ